MEILQKLLTVKPGMIARRSLLNTNPRSFKNDRSTRVTKVDVDCQAERSNIENLHKIVMPITYQGLLTSGVAFAEASTESVEQAAATPEWLSYFLVALPLLAYGGFTIFREKVNPRANALDFVFLAAATLILANLFTILFLKIRLY